MGLVLLRSGGGPTLNAGKGEKHDTPASFALELNSILSEFGHELPALTPSFGAAISVLLGSGGRI